MNRLLLMLFLFFYLYAVSGVKVGVHYCHGHFSTITFNANPDEDACCSKKQPMKKHACCKDNVVEIKIKEEQRSSTAQINLSGGLSSLVFNQLAAFYFKLPATTSVFYAFKSPPGGCYTGLIFIKNCIFRI